MTNQTTKMSRTKIIYRGLVLLCMLTCLFAVFRTLSINNLLDERLYDSRLTALTDGWYTVDESGDKKGITDLLKWSATSGRELWLGRTLPKVTS